MSCPGLHELEQLAAGERDHPLNAAVVSHVQVCARCRALVAVLKSHLDLAQRLQHLPVEAAAPDSEDTARAQLSTTPEPQVGSFPGYRIVQELSRGGQGVVWEAVRVADQHRVAIKVIRGGPLAGPAERARFDREVLILRELKHPGIVSIHESGVSAGYPYYVMDLVDGCQLDEHIEFGTCGVDRIVRLAVAIAGIVQAAHNQGVIHRDLKPGNIRIDSGGAPHVLDFGLAKNLAVLSTTAHTETGQFVGSLPWASPEQTESARACDVRSDVYSLGVVIFQMLTGRFPCATTGSLREILASIRDDEPPKPSDLRPDVPEDLDFIVLTCLAKNPDHRYQSVSELTRDLRRFRRGEAIQARSDNRWYMLNKTLQRFAAPASVATALVVQSVLGSPRRYTDQSSRQILQRHARVIAVAFATLTCFVALGVIARAVTFPERSRFLADALNLVLAGAYVSALPSLLGIFIVLTIRPVGTPRRDGRSPLNLGGFALLAIAAAAAILALSYQFGAIAEACIRALLATAPGALLFWALQRVLASVGARGLVRLARTGFCFSLCAGVGLLVVTALQRSLSAPPVARDSAISVVLGLMSATAIVALVFLWSTLRLLRQPDVAVERRTT